MRSALFSAAALGLSFATADAAGPPPVNPFPEDAVAQPAVSTTTKSTANTNKTAPAAKTPAKATAAATKSSRNLIWRSAEPAAEVEAAPAKAEPAAAEPPQPTPARPQTEAAKTVSVKVDTPAETHAQPKSEATRISVVVDGDKSDAKVEQVVNLAGTKSVMATPAQFIAPDKEPTQLQPAAAPILKPAQTEPTPHEAAATKIAVKATPTGAVRQVAEDLPLPSRSAALRLQGEPNMLPPGNLPPGGGYTTPTPTPGPYTEPAPSAQPPQGSPSPMTQYDSCSDAQSKCQEAWDKVKNNVIADIDLNIKPHPLAGNPQALQGRDYPCECVLPRGTFEPRCWSPTDFEWLASAVCYKPLYFEESSLERYGHTHHPFIQPFVSGAHFFGTFPILPYKMGVETPCECVYPLGTYRPGDCAPRICDGVPLSYRGALFETGAVLGAVYIIP